MRYVKVAGIVWGLVYFAMGVLKSFTLNSLDFWSSIAVLLALFLLPLPIAFVALWFPKLAGKTLLLCITVNFAAAASVVASRHASPLADMAIFITFIAIYNIPHFFFAVAYIFTRASAEAS